MPKSDILRSIAVSALLVSACFAGADDGSSSHYVLVPVRTELQRYLLNSRTADTYLEINADAFLAEGSPDSHGMQNFLGDLRTYVRTRSDPEPVVKMYLRFADLTSARDQRKKLENALKVACQEAGFVKVSSGMRFESDPWETKVARLKSFQSPADALESPIDRELCRIFPVRTALSRFLLGENVTCVVQLGQPIDGRFRELGKSVREGIIQSVATLDLPPNGVLIFRFLTTTTGRESAERYFGPAESSPANRFAKEMGFRSSLWSTTPMHVAPEDLLGKKVPDFTLESLNGDEVNLHEAIRGRVAVISFWGVACGPCRMEAPQLTELYQRYGANGLAVIAVNSYNEAKEVVAKFVQEESLKHTIALMGRNVAQGKYAVASHPVTFLVDHNGVLKDYHLGFEPGDEEQLFVQVEQLLRERNQDVDQR